MRMSSQFNYGGVSTASRLPWDCNRIKQLSTKVLCVMAATVSRKSRPKSLRNRSIASSNLPTLHHQFSKTKHEAIDVSMSSTSELIVSAFKDLRITAKSEITGDSSQVNGPGNGSSDSNGFCSVGLGTCCILTEGMPSENCPVETDQGDRTSQPLILEEDNIFSNVSPEQCTAWKMPLSVRESSLGRNNLSSSSIDSGVYSPRGGSKRPSFELGSPVDPLFQSNQDLHRPRRSRTMSGKRITPTVSIDDTDARKKTARLSVDEKAFSELLQAATTLVLGAQSIDEPENAGLHGDTPYLKNSLQYFKRRKSEWDLTTLKPQPEKVVPRKKSAESILQRISITSSNIESSSRRVSACIICERNQRAKDNASSSILVKTTMVQTMQKRRRFSEVLKVYKPEDLPFTEFVFPKICQLKTPTEPPKDETKTLKDLVDDNMPVFVRLTNWNSLYAHLVSKRLLDAHMREFMLSPSSTNQEKGNKFYGEHMLTHGPSGYQRLLQCYQEETDHSGHETLAKLLEGHAETLTID